MKRPHRRIARPGSKGTDSAYESRSLFTWYIHLPITRFLFRLRRRLGIRIGNDPMLPFRGPFYMTGHTSVGSDPGLGFQSVWQQRLPDAVRIQRERYERRSARRQQLLPVIQKGLKARDAIRRS